MPLHSHRSPVPECARTPAAAEVDAAHNPGHSSCCCLLRWMRESSSSPRMPSAARFVVCAAFLSRAAVSGLAGVMSLVGLTHLTTWALPPGQT